MLDFVLVEKIEGDNIEYRASRILGRRRIKEMTRLTVDDTYHIIRKIIGRYIIYTHFRNSEIVKICIYKRSKRC